MSSIQVYFQDPMHPLGMWDNPHVSTDNFYWRVINGSGAFGPGGFLSRLIMLVMMMLLMMRIKLGVYVLLTVLF